ncbi:MAG: ATP-binding protein [Pseudomonadota bacterium]|nr:ATP-binding protein [Pseudomonadota bacterium]
MDRKWGLGLRIITGCCLLLWHAAVCAADTPGLMLEHLTPSEGMPQGTVMATLQDSQGFIWLGTEDGLVRFDGHDLVRYAYSRNSSDGLPGNFIYQIVEDQQKNLWVAVKDAGIARWNRATDSFTTFRHDPANDKSLASDVVRALLVDKGGHVWVGMTGSGVDVIDPATGIATHMRHDPNNAKTLSDDQVLTLTFDKYAALWVGTTVGLDQWHSETNEFLHYRRGPGDLHSPGGDQVSQVLPEGRATLWVGTLDGGLYQLDGSGHLLKTYRHDPANARSLSSNEVRAILRDRAGRLWVGTREGLDLLEPTTETFIHYRHDESDSGSLRDSYIMSLYEDTAGLIWIGTRQGGVSRWNPRSWELGGHRPSWLVGKLVTSFADAPNRKVWIGSLGGGLVRFDDESAEATDVDSILHKTNALGDRRVMSLLTDRHDNLWIGMMADGLKTLSPSGKLESIGARVGDNHSLSAAGVMTIFESHSGELWIGTHGGGANILNPVTGIIRQLAHTADQAGAISADSVTAIAEDAAGNIWIGTDGGGLDLARPDGSVVKVFRNDPNSSTSLPSNTIYSIAISKKGQVWIATDKGGIARVIGSPEAPDDIVFDVASREDGLSSDTIYAIVPDAAGSLWLSGNAGLMRLDPDSRQIKTFHREHGLQGEEFDFNASLRLRDGRLCFGGPGGFNTFDPSRLTENNLAPRVALTRLEVLGVPVRSNTPYWQLDRIKLDYNASIASLDFAALDFTSPKRNKLEYRIAGLADRWIELGAQRRITLTNLDAGDHLLEVRGANADSVWSDPPLRLIVHRNPAPWRSPAAYAIYGLLLLALAGYRIRMTRARLARVVSAKERLESQVALRTRELLESNRQLEEASQAKSTFLARMSHELRTPMNGVVGSTELLARTPQSPKQKRLTDTIRSSANVLLQIVNDLLDLSKMQAGKICFERIEFDLSRVVEECATLFSGGAESKNIELVVCPPVDPIMVTGDELRIRQILMNLVGNAIKFTAQGEVAIKTDINIDDRHEAKVQITVTDTGIGMDPAAMQRIFEPFSQADESTTRRFGGSGLGLSICRELADRMGGTIEVESSPGVGSLFRVILPLAVAETGSLKSPAPTSGASVQILTHRDSMNEALTRHALSLGYDVSQDGVGGTLIVDLGTHHSFFLDEANRARFSRSAFVVVATTRQLERLQETCTLNPASVVYKPVQRAELDKALREAVRLPRAAIPDAAGRQPHSDLILGHVLLVEDEAVNALIAQGYLSELGCSSVWVTDGAEAVARCLKERFDLVMMDLNMPGMDGFAAATLIRKHELKDRRIPIIALTAHHENGYREVCLQSGMDGLLSKPYTLEQFRGTLVQWIKKPAAANGTGASRATLAERQPLATVDAPSVTALRNLRSTSDGDLFSRLVDSFQRSSSEAIEQLEITLGRGDYTAAGALCHKLAAAAANVGALKFGRELRMLEQACAFNDAAGAGEIARRLVEALPLLCAELAKWQVREIA